MPSILSFTRFRVRRVGTLALALTAITASTVLAHGALKSSTPASGSHLSVAPRELRLVFNEAPELTFTTVDLLGPDRTVVALGPLTLTGNPKRTIVAAVIGRLSAGTYTVRWKMAGTDGHPVRGTFRFTIAPGAEGLTALPPATPPSAARGEPAGGVTAPGQNAAPAEHHNPVSMPGGEGFNAESAGYVAIRWVQFTGLLLVLGAVAFSFVVLGFLGRTAAPDMQMLKEARDQAATLGLWAGCALAGTTLLRLYAQSYAMHGATDALNWSLVGAMLRSTVWGWGWLLQAVGVLVAVAGFTRARRGRSAGWSLAALGAVALAFTPALSGHAASSPKLTSLAVLADGAHVMGAGGWLGSLLFVVAVGIPAAMRLDEGRRGSAVAALINAFSPTALAFAGVSAATGLFAAWLHLESVSALWQSQYGRTLLLKLGILSLVVATGAYNWLRVRPSLGNAGGMRRIRRSATVELAVGALVLIVTAILVATPMEMDMPTISGTEAAGASETALVRDTTR